MFSTLLDMVCMRSSDNEEELQIEWMHGLPAPEAILNLMSCNSVSA